MFSNYRNYYNKEPEQRCMTIETTRPFSQRRVARMSE